MKTLILGGSHVNAFAGALRQNPDPSINVIFKKSEVIHMIKSMDENSLTNPQNWLEGIKQDQSPIDVLGLCLAGNAHNVFALINDPVPFYLTPSQPNGKLVTKSLMMDLLRQNFTVLLEFANLLVEKLLPRHVILINPPPPGGDAAHITQYPSIFEKHLERGVSPDSHRVQMYKLQTAVYQEHARSLGAGFLPTPTASFDERGMLAREYWQKDPTHANFHYGALVLDDLRRMIGEMT